MQESSKARDTCQGCPDLVIGGVNAEGAADPMTIDPAEDLRQMPDEREQDFDDAAFALDDGGGVMLVDAPVPFTPRVRELVIFAASREIALFAKMANEMEARGERPLLKVHRDELSEIDGFILCAQVA